MSDQFEIQSIGFLTSWLKCRQQVGGKQKLLHDHSSTIHYIHLMRTCINAWISLNFGQKPPLTMELAALECLKNRCHHFFSVAIDLILLKVAGNEDMHNILDEFQFRPDQRARWLSCRASHSGARGWGFKTYLCRVVSLSKTLYSLKVLVIPRKRWLCPSITEKLLTLSLNTNKNKKKDRTINYAELAVLDRSKNSHRLIMGGHCHLVFSAVFDLTLFIFAGNENIHKSLDEFKLWPDPTY